MKNINFHFFLFCQTFNLHKSQGILLEEGHSVSLFIKSLICIPFAVRQKDRKTERQKDRKTERQKDRETERQKDRKTESRKTERQKDRSTERQTDRQTDRKTENRFFLQ